MVKLRYALATAWAFINNLLAEQWNAHLARKKRLWTAHGVGGFGVVPLGLVNQSDAIDKVAKFGTLVYVDEEHAIIMYRAKS